MPSAVHPDPVRNPCIEPEELAGKFIVRDLAARDEAGCQYFGTDGVAFSNIGKRTTA